MADEKNNEADKIELKKPTIGDDEQTAKITKPPVAVKPSDSTTISPVATGSSNLSVSMSQKEKGKTIKLKPIVPQEDENGDQEETLSMDRETMMNKKPNIDGILIQLPLPPQIDTTKILELVEPSKDVDGFHPYNVGRLTTGLDGFAPCTPLGVMELLSEYDIDVKGKNCVVIGASNIVGKPMASLLLNADATVEICHIFTDDLKKHTLNADMIFVGVGVINLITEDMVKDDVVIIDIGVSRTKEGKLVGDVDFENVSKKSSYITPSPGGVGPMTIAMLLSNTLKAAKINAAKLHAKESL